MTKEKDTPIKNSDELSADSLRDQVIGRMSLFILLILLLVAGLSYQTNMFGFPAFLDAEGTNIANAWAVIEQGTMTPYTYAYEESPLSNYLFAAWFLATDGFETFGFPVSSGRVLMFIFHMLSVALVFLITRRLSNNDLAAIIATLIFALSPLALSIQRRVLTDNMMLVFLLTAFYSSVGRGRSLYSYMLSAACFGIAVLIQAGTIIFLPAFIYAIRQSSLPFHRRFALNIWMLLSLIIIILYPLYAAMREELFPQGWIFGGDFPHVSLLERVMDSGPADTFIGNLGSGVGTVLTQWTDLSNFTADPVLIYGGLLSSVFLMILAKDNRILRPLVAFVLMYLFGLLISGRIVVTDVIVILPFLAACLGIVLGLLVTLVSGIASKGFMKPVLGLISLVVLLYPFWIFYSARPQLYTLDQTTGQIAAVDWIEENASTTATIIVDNYAWTALRDEMPNIHHYWKIDTDPDVKFTLLEDSHCNIDYMITTPQVYSDRDIFRLDLVRRTILNSSVIQAYDNNGWPIEVLQVSKSDCEEAFLPSFGTSEGSETPDSGAVEEPTPDADAESSEEDSLLPSVNT